MKNAIAIIDDEKQIRVILSKMVEKFQILEKNDLEIIEFESAQDFLNYEVNHGISNIYLILLDIMMPEVSGIEMVHVLHEKKSIANIPVLFLTAYSNEADITETFSKVDALAFDYIPKPFDTNWLLAKIQNLLRIKIHHVKLQKLSREVIDAYAEMSKFNKEILETLDESEAKTDYLTQRLLKIIRKHTAIDGQKESASEIQQKLDTLEKLFANMIVNDMYLARAIRLFLEGFNKIYYNLIFTEGADTEIINIFPNTVEAINTIIADIEQIKYLVEDIGFITRAKEQENNFRHTSFYEYIKDSYQKGMISQELFDKFKAIGESAEEESAGKIIML